LSAKFKQMSKEHTAMYWACDAVCSSGAKLSKDVWDRILYVMDNIDEPKQTEAQKIKNFVRMVGF